MAGLTDKIKERALKSFLPMAIDYLEPVLENLKEAKENFEYQEGEEDVILIFFFRDNEVFGSVCTISNDNTIKRQIIVEPVREFLMKFIKK